MQNCAAACFRPPDRDQTVRRATNFPPKIGHPTPSAALFIYLLLGKWYSRVKIPTFTTHQIKKKIINDNI
jgi:hypothetical protein